jgi:hypothetical protein
MLKTNMDDGDIHGRWFHGFSALQLQILGISPDPKKSIKRPGVAMTISTSALLLGSMSYG